MQKELLQMIVDIEEDVIKWRRHLHRNPELSFCEEKTSQFVFDVLKTFENLEISRPTKTGIVARLVGARPGKVIALRADMDALPLQEGNDFSYASNVKNVMHACGHDGHTAILLGTAKILNSIKNTINGEIRFIFQHAEELPPGGAKELVEAGVMDGVDAVVGAHLWSSLDVGKLGFVYGPILAAPDTFWITIFGKGGHAALPHQTVDPIIVGAQVVINLQQIVSRQMNPLDDVVVSVTQFNGGTSHNIIPGSVEICGTVRTFKSELRTLIPQHIERITKGVAEAHGAQYSIKYEPGYKAVVNNESVTRSIEQTAREIFSEDAVELVHPNMWGEDFSAYLEKVPGCFFFIGAGNKEKGITYPQHHPFFDIDEEALIAGIKIFVLGALKLLE